MPRNINNEVREIPEKEKLLASEIYKKFKDAMVAKASYTERWFTYLNAWNNSLFEKQYLPAYKTNHVSNFIYSSIESMRPVLFDQNPKFEAIPVTAEGMEYANDMNTILDWEWDRSNMQEIALANSIYTFAIGTSIIMLPYQFKKDRKSNVDGEVTPIPVSPFNLYPDPLATSVEDAEYLIYANYIHVNILKEKYPDKAEWIQGGDVNYSELVNDRNENARLNNQVLVLEMWCRDYTTVTEEDGKKKRKYPRGRVIICAPELDLVLEDKENPYKTGRFPFFLFKDIDVPFQFWGEGEVKWLMSPQKEINDLYNQVIDNAKHTANMQWIIDKNAGIPKGELTNRPGLIIRKNPGSEVRRDGPPAMPMYVSEMIERLKNDVEVVSGIHDVTRGQTPSGIQSASAIMALQEAAQTRIRLKVTLHENALGELGTEWLERIKQFWKFNRIIPKKVDETSKLNDMKLNGIEMQPMPPMMNTDSSYEMIEVSPDRQLKHDYIIKVKGASVMKNSRANMLDQMIRLMQTPAEDGMPCVPREAVLDYLPDVNKQLVMQYFQKLKEERMAEQQQQQMNNQAMEQVGILSQQMQEVQKAVQDLYSRAQQEEDERQRNDLMSQGYEQGMDEANLMQTQLDKSGQLPPELLREIAELDDEAMAQLLQSNPELLDMLGVE